VTYTHAYIWTDRQSGCQAVRQTDRYILPTYLHTYIMKEREREREREKMVIYFNAFEQKFGFVDAKK